MDLLSNVAQKSGDKTGEKRFNEGFEVRFNAKEHTYYCTETGYIFQGCTSWLDQFKPPFDPDDEILIAKAKEKKMDPEALRAEWNANNFASKKRGTEIHDFLEAFFEQKQYKDPACTGRGGLYDIAENVVKSIPTLSLPYVEVLTEVVISNHDMGIASKIDLLILDGNKAIIYDYKTNKNLRQQSFFNERLNSPFDFLQNCDIDVYSLQLGVYGAILRRAGFTVAGMAIIHINELDFATKLVVPGDFIEYVDQFFNQKITSKNGTPVFDSEVSAVLLPTVVTPSQSEKSADDFLSFRRSLVQKRTRKKIAETIFQSVENGQANALQQYIHCDALGKFADETKALLKNKAQEVAKKYSRGDQVLDGVKFEFQETGTRYDYKSSPIYEDIEDKRKAIENVLKTGAEKFTFPTIIQWRALDCNNVETYPVEGEIVFFMVKDGDKPDKLFEGVFAKGAFWQGKVEVKKNEIAPSAVTYWLERDAIIPKIALNIEPVEKKSTTTLVLTYPTGD